jgi:DNA-binding beta-propeller fold protein YncE
MRFHRRTVLQAAAAALAFPACQLSLTEKPTRVAGPVAVTQQGVRAELDVLQHRLTIAGRTVARLGLDAGQLNGPAGVVALGERFYVLETGNHRVQVFDTAGASLEVLEGPGLLYPRGLTVLEGKLLVADSRNGRLVELDPASGAHRLLGEGTLVAPWGLAVTNEGIVVADPGKRAVLLLDRDGQLRRELGEGWTLPYDVAADRDVLFVVDGASSEVAVLDASGRRQSAIQLERSSSFVQVGSDGRLQVG